MDKILTFDGFVNENAEYNAALKAWFYVAAKGSTYSLNSYMVNDGIDINAKDDTFGQTALFVAAQNNQYDTVEWLIENGADVNMLDKFGHNVLTGFKSCNFTKKMIKLLISNHVDISVSEHDSPFNRNSAILQDRGIQETIIKKQPWNIKFFDDHVGFLPELKVKYKDAFYISDLNI